MVAPDNSGSNALRLLIFAIVGITLCVTLGGILLTLAPALVLGLLGFSAFDEGMEGFTDIGTQIAEVSTIAVEVPDVVAPLLDTPEPGFATELLRFGTEGTQPGQLDDARSLAILPDGSMFLADYQTGRIQKFDAQGNFLTQIVIPDEPIILDVGADRSGTLYVVYGGPVHRYNSETGEYIGPWTASGIYIDSIDVMADGRIAAWGRDNLVIFNTGGGVQMTIPDIVEGVSGDSELSANIAVDGLGNIFLLGSFNGSVFAYDAQGTFKNRFGSQGTEEGQFRALQDIAIDPQGRVLVGDIFGIYVFEPDGRQAGFITLEGVPFGMAFDSDGYLWVTNRSTVFKMQVNE
jgi:hypothetical protein